MDKDQKLCTHFSGFLDTGVCIDKMNVLGDGDFTELNVPPFTMRKLGDDGVVVGNWRVVDQVLHQVTVL